MVMRVGYAAEVAAARGVPPPVPSRKRVNRDNHKLLLGHAVSAGPQRHNAGQVRLRGDMWGIESAARRPGTAWGNTFGGWSS
jgi:hypothetical protein